MLTIPILGSPCTRLDEINFRQSLVAFFVTRPHVRDDVRRLLSGAEDATRILQRFLLGRGLPSDFSSLNSSIITWISINRRFNLEREQELKERGQLKVDEWSCVDTLLGRMKNLAELSVRITASLTRTDLSADLEPGPPETEEGEEATLDLDSPAAEINLTSGAAKWMIRPEWGCFVISSWVGTNVGLAFQRSSRVSTKLWPSYSRRRTLCSVS